MGFGRPPPHNNRCKANRASETCVKGKKPKGSFTPTVLIEPGEPEVRRVRRLDQMPSLWILNQGQQVLLAGAFHLLEDLGVKGQDT